MAENKKFESLSTVWTSQQKSHRERDFSREKKFQNFLEKNFATSEKSSHDETTRYFVAVFDNSVTFHSIGSFRWISEDARGVRHSVVWWRILVGRSSSREIDSRHWIQEWYGCFGLRWSLWLWQWPSSGTLSSLFFFFFFLNCELRWCYRFRKKNEICCLGLLRLVLYIEILILNFWTWWSMKHRYRKRQYLKFVGRYSYSVTYKISIKLTKKI